MEQAKRCLPMVSFPGTLKLTQQQAMDWAAARCHGGPLGESKIKSRLKVVDLEVAAMIEAGDVPGWGLGSPSDRIERHQEIIREVEREVGESFARLCFTPQDPKPGWDKVTKGGIEKAMKTAGRPVKERRELLERMRESGAIKVGTTRGFVRAKK
tara:strand:- start:68 stop:532 length:465 start_codon:yes stop_codon:yes gene_type:complete